MSRYLKVLVLILAVVILVPTLGFAAENADKRVVVNGKVLHMKSSKDTKGVVIVPLRETMESLGYSINWDASAKETRITKNKEVYTIKTDSDVIKIGTFIQGMNVWTEKKLRGNVTTVKDVTMVPIDILNTVGVNYYTEGDTIQIYDKFIVTEVSQDNSFIERLTNKADLARVETMLYNYGTKNNVIYKKYDYLDYTSITDMYKYISTMPTEKEITSSKYSWDEYLSADVNKITLQNLTRTKSIIALSGVSASFEPAVYYNIGNKIELIGGYVNYGDNTIDIKKSQDNYIKNYQDISWIRLNETSKLKIKTEVSKEVTRINTNKSMVIFLLKDGKIVYME